ncbi:MAG: hypothetical protein M1822_009719 [Bathelium mastoideum]|nr:MAG: hypothetical protein M1822_009719 [Bathelium mastoideum]
MTSEAQEKKTATDQSQDAGAPIQLAQTKDEEPYSIYSTRQKKAIVFGASVAALFSPLSANIYFPALNSLASDLHVSTNLINLTVTTYLIFQGIAPTFVGSFSDSAGRRPAYVVCFVIYIAANIGLALQDDYAAILVLRMVQASGSSGTVALASAVAADIVTSSERGSYIGYTAMGTMLGPSVAPVIGGLLDQYCGWKWIFWFLVIFSASFFIVLLLFLPETCRAVVGNGSIPPPVWNMGLISLFQRHRARRRRTKEAQDTELGRTVTQSSQLSRAKARIHWPSPMAVFRIIADRINLVILLSCALLFAAYYAVSASIPARFAEKYGYSTLDISLIFIPIGIGSAISAFTTGRAMDWRYRVHARRLGITIEKDKKAKQQEMLKFPIERARLEIAMPLMLLGGAIIIAYGWCVEEAVSVAGPVVLLFFLGFTLVAGFQSFNVLIVDLNRSAPATATAATNLVRCLFGAGASALVNPLTERVGYGWTCTIAAGVWMSFLPLLYLLMRNGQDWRKKKAARLAAEQNAMIDSTNNGKSDSRFTEDEKCGGNEENDTEGNGEKTLRTKDEEALGINNVPKEIGREIGKM